jgi:hypothetical protein
MWRPDAGPCILFCVQWIWVLSLWIVSHLFCHSIS